MNTREQFGNYLLLKKLTEDPLGETFRAGLLGASGMERVVLLRIFNGQGVEGPRLWEASRNRREVQNILRSPNIGEGVEMGEIQGIPYVAYDYVSGKNLTTLLDQAAKKRNFISAEHALLIAERIAQALAVASENRLDGERILHGFLVPRLVMISNEGETRLLGFEVSPGLRGFAANPVIRQHFGRYLAPEALAGAPPHKSDDIYSMGVVLFELLTGRPLPPPAAGGYGPVVDQGMLAVEATQIPEVLRELLKKSLVAREQRTDDIVAWHKRLNQWMIDSQYNPTTFNLAFFMHNLFRQEIERESQEIEVEKTLPVPVVERPPAAAPVAPPPVAAPLSAARPPSEDTGVGISESTENFIPEYAREEKSKAGLWIGIAAALVILVGTALFMMSQRGDSRSEPPPEVTTAPPPEEPAGPSEEELAALRAQLDELVQKKADDMAEQLRTQHEAQIKDLQKQLDEAKKAAERRQKLEAERAQREADAKQKEEEEAAKAAALAEAQKKKEAEQAKAEKESKAEQTAQTTPAPVPPPVVQPPPPPKAATPPAARQVRRGDLVEMGPGVKPPQTRRIAPRFPEMARRMNKTDASVQVRVLIDENGVPLKVEQVGDKVGFGFDNEALQAAKKATFDPATKDGVPVKFWFTINVEFKM